jgi:hypothetical protein
MASPGYHLIEPIVLNYFDPNQKKYKDVSTDKIDLMINQGEGVAGAEIPYNMVSGQTINLNETDIRFIKVENGSLRRRGRILLTSPVFLTIMALPLAVIFGGMIDVRRRRRLVSDIGYARQRRAASEAKKRLKTAEDYLKSDDEAAFYAELSGVVYQFIADKFNVSAQGLTSEGVRDLFHQKNVGSELLKETVAVLEAADFGRFAGSGSAGSDREDLFRRAQAVISGLGEAL